VDALTGTVALFTGATKNSGAKIVRALADAVATIVATGRVAQDGEHVVRGVRSSGGTAAVVGTDLTCEDAVQSGIGRGAAEFDRRDLLDAPPSDGLQFGADKPIAELAPADLERVVQVGILGTTWVLTYSRPHIVRLYDWLPPKNPVPVRRRPRAVGDTPGPVLRHDVRHPARGKHEGADR
jgi:NAD(P)-dependent dehydrogenase (short-subunit alcohol dehydrogenase family)